LLSEVGSGTQAGGAIAVVLREPWLREFPPKTDPPADRMMLVTPSEEVSKMPRITPFDGDTEPSRLAR